ncbi:MAG: baseplate J/gp47 family protein [Pseudomonadota bacterium]
MSFDRAGLTAIEQRIRASMEAEMPGVPIVRKGSMLGALARALAGAIMEVLGFGDWVYRQTFPDTADSANLERHAGLHGVVRAEASRAVGTVTFTGVDGTVIDTGTRLGDAGGFELQTTENAVIAGGSAIVAVEAAATGAAGNLVEGAAFSLLSSAIDVDSSATVAAPGLALGADAESDARLLQRLLLKLREPEDGGKDSDYVRWALDVPGVTRVWVAGNEPSIGAVTVRFLVDDAPHGPIPTAGEIAAVQTALDQLRPVTADLRVVAPVLTPIDITLSVTPDTPDVRAAVTAKLSELLAREGEPGARIYLTHIGEAVSGAPGEVTHAIAAPADDVETGAGSIPVLGVVTFL